MESPALELDIAYAGGDIHADIVACASPRTCFYGTGRASFRAAADVLRMGQLGPAEHRVYHFPQPP